MVPRVRAVPVPTQRLSHALGGTAAPSSMHMSVVAPVTALLAKSSDHELSGNKPPSPQGAKGTEAMEIDDNDLRHLLYGLEQNDIDNYLPHSSIVRDDHNLASEGDEMQEDWPHSSANPSVSSGAGGGRTLTGRGGLDGTPAAEPGGQAPRSLIEDSSRNRHDGSMEIDNACPGQFIDIGHLDDSEHKAGNPKRKQLEKKKSPGKQNE